MQVKWLNQTLYSSRPAVRAALGLFVQNHPKTRHLARLGIKEAVIRYVFSTMARVARTNHYLSGGIHSNDNDTRHHLTVVYKRRATDKGHMKHLAPGPVLCRMAGIKV